MSIKDLTITDQNVQSTYVQSQPDRLTGTAQQNKAVFDAFPQLIRQRFNALLEAMAGAGAAGEIPVGPIEGVTAENVQQALEAIQKNLTAYINKIKSTTGAAEVGVSAISGMTAQNVQKALEELRKAIEDSVSGIIPGGSITEDMLSDGVKTILSNKVDKILPLQTGTDLNTVLASGNYRLAGDSEDFTNTPPGINVGWCLMNVVGDTDTVAQTLYILGGDRWGRMLQSGLFWSKWTQIDTGTTLQKYPLPLEQYVKEEYAKFWKMPSGMVFGTFDVKLKSGIPSSYPTIARFPLGFRPSDSAYASAVLSSGEAVGIAIKNDGAMILSDVDIISLPEKHLKGIFFFIAE